MWRSRVRLKYTAVAPGFLRRISRKLYRKVGGGRNLKYGRATGSEKCVRRNIQKDEATTDNVCRSFIPHYSIYTFCPCFLNPIWRLYGDYHT